MDTRGRLALASTLAGLIVLWIGVSPASELVFLGPNACRFTGTVNPLELGWGGRMVYRRCGTVYEYAWPVIAAMALLGTTLLANGVRLYVRE